MKPRSSHDTKKKREPFLNKKPHATTKPDNKSTGQQAAVCDDLYVHMATRA
ncbi:MAG: hypothetical protein V3U08_06440 [Nitrospirales bacterium]